MSVFLCFYSESKTLDSWQCFLRAVFYLKKHALCQCRFNVYLNHLLISCLGGVWWDACLPHQIIVGYPSKHKTFVWYLYNVGPTSSTLVRHCINLYKCFVFAGVEWFPAACLPPPPPPPPSPPLPPGLAAIPIIDVTTGHYHWLLPASS